MLTPSLSRAICLFAIGLGGCAVDHFDIPYTEQQRNRTVIEEQSQQVVPNAIVAFIWRANVADGHASRLTCEHTELTRSDDQGRYAIPTWRGRSPMIQAIYKRGLSKKYDAEANRRGVDIMIAFNGSSTDRYTELGYILNALNCDERESRNDKDLFIAMNEEAIAMVRTEADARAAEVFQGMVDFVLYGEDEARARHTARAVARTKSESAR